MKEDHVIYSFEYQGDCLGDIVPDGSILYADPEAEIRPMDIVAVLLERANGPWLDFINAAGEDGFVGVCKLYMGSYEAMGETVHVVGQLYPPVISPIPACAIAAMDRVIGGHLGLQEMTEGDEVAVRLLAPFVCGAPERIQKWA